MTFDTQMTLALLQELLLALRANDPDDSGDDQLMDWHMGAAVA